MKDQQKFGRRREPRFKTTDEQALQCACFHEEDKPERGSIIDISTSGLRLLCDGKYSVGQTVLFELGTDRSFGAFGGIVRRVEPWVGGRCLLGCELIEKIPDDLLETLASEGVINRRQDDRVAWKKPVKVSWELHPEEVGAEIQNCSAEGMKLASDVEIPENVCVRVCLESDKDQPIVIEAKTVWQLEEDQQRYAGVAFQRGVTPTVIADVLAKYKTRKSVREILEEQPLIRMGLVVAASLILACVTLF